MVEAREVLAEKGPLTGKEFIFETGLETFEAWRLCVSDQLIIKRVIGRRYLRLDARVAGYARLSPSIMREFLNYTLVGLEKDRQALEERGLGLEKEIKKISKKKIGIAGDSVKRLLKGHRYGQVIADQACFIIAGDVVFNMAHSEPRPESSTGELVRGSDLDIITVTDGLPDNLQKDLDTLLYREKYNLLMNPASKEEIDYIIKNLDTVREHLKFSDFKAMVASKILAEGEYLYGSRDLFKRIKTLVDVGGIGEKICLLEEKARQDRIRAEQVLSSAPPSADREQLMSLFYTTEEKEEIF